MPRVILTLAVIGVAVFALSDLANARKDQTGGLPKWLWAVIIVITPIIGGLAWIVFRQASRSATRLGPISAQDTPQRRGPVAPDDDPEFLWRLAQEQERRRREGLAGEPDDA